MDLAVVAVFITLIVGCLYMFFRRTVTSTINMVCGCCGDDDDIETDGDQRTKIRHEGGL